MNQNMTDKKKDRPFVFVRCLTYNHEKYIEDALKGFVMQKTDFPFLAVVIDDCSTDGTADIVRRYEAQYPDIIKGIYLPHNFRSRGEDKRPYYQEYVDKATYWAECEGDDYWTDPLKLQKQVDILEKDESLMMCCTNCSVVDKHSVELHAVRGGVVKDDIEGRYNLRDFFRDNHQYPTLSVVYRRAHTREVQQKYAHTINAFLGDWTLWICLLIYGDMYFLNEVTCAYRINPTSVTHTVNRVARAKANREICKSVADILPDEYADIAADLRDTRWVWISLIFAYKAERRYLGMMGALIMSLIRCPRGLWKILKDKIK